MSVGMHNTLRASIVDQATKDNRYPTDEEIARLTARHPDEEARLLFSAIRRRRDELLDRRMAEDPWVHMRSLFRETSHG